MMVPFLAAMVRRTKEALDPNRPSPIDTVTETYEKISEARESRLELDRALMPSGNIMRDLAVGTRRRPVRGPR